MGRPRRRARATNPRRGTRDNELDALRTKLHAKTAECRELRQRLDASATVIAGLHHDNEALREHLDSRTGTITDLGERRAEATNR